VPDAVSGDLLYLPAQFSSNGIEHPCYRLYTVDLAVWDYSLNESLFFAWHIDIIEQDDSFCIILKFALAFVSCSLNGREGLRN